MAVGHNTVNNILCSGGDAVDAVVLLATDDNKFIRGQTLIVNGGRYRH